MVSIYFKKCNTVIVINKGYFCRWFFVCLSYNYCGSDYRLLICHIVSLLVTICTYSGVVGWLPYKD